MFCPQCGAENKDGAASCVQCNTSFVHVAASQPMPGEISGKAVASLVLGIIGLVGCWLITGIPAIILGILGRRDVRRSPQRLSGSGLAVVGIVLGCCSIFSPGAMMVAISVSGLMRFHAISKPASMSVREISRATSCMENLIKLEGAVDMWAVEDDKPDGATCTMTNLVGQDLYLKKTPRCPGGGKYPDVFTVGVTPTCTYVMPAWFDTQVGKFSHAIPSSRL